MADLGEIIQTTQPTTEPEHPPFNWTLNRKEWTTTIFAKKKMREYVPIELIYGFIKAELGIAYGGISRYSGMPTTIKTELDLIKNFKNLYKEKDKYFSVAHTLPKHKWGRTIPVNYLSLSVMHRPTRHRFCLDGYRDIDIRNCQPEITEEICKQNGITDNVALPKYVADPKKYRKKIMDYHGCGKDAAKQLPISIMFGGKYDSWIRENNITQNDNGRLKIFLDLEREMTKITEIVYKANKDLVKDVKKHNNGNWRTIAEEKRGCMALWAQTIERRMMEEAVMFLVQQKDFVLEDIVPCQDGLMICEDLWYNGILDDISAVIKQKYRFNLVFVDKPFDEALEIPVYEGEVRHYEEWVDELSTKRLSQRLVELVGKYILTSGGRVYVYHGDRWYNDTKNHYKLRRFISEELYDDRIIPIRGAIELSEENREKLIKLCRDVTSNDSTLKSIINHTLSVVENVDNNHFDNKPYLLGFENGVMELPTKTFRPYRFDDYITLTTEYNYEPVDYAVFENRKKRLLLMKIFNDIQPDYKKNKLLYQVECSCLDGVNYQKCWFYNGKGGNGKGYLSRLKRRLLGKNFAYYPRESLIKNIDAGGSCSPDIADMRYKRLILFTEMGGKTRVTALRRLTGGDQYTGSQKYEDNQQFTLHATTILEFNKTLDFDEKFEPADYRRIVDFDFPTNYTDDPDKIGKVVEGIIYRKANPYYTSDLFVENHYLIWLDILLDKYQDSYSESVGGIDFEIPDVVRRHTKEKMDNKNIFARCFNSLYEPADDKKEDIPANRLKTGNIFNLIKETDTYKQLSNTQKVENWGKKEFNRWAETFLGAKKDSKGMWYVVGYSFSDDDIGSVDDEIVDS